MLYKKARTSTLMLMYETSSLLGCEKGKRLLAPQTKKIKIQGTKIINTLWMTQIIGSKSSLFYYIFSVFIIHKLRTNMLVFRI